MGGSYEGPRSILPFAISSSMHSPFLCASARLLYERFSLACASLLPSLPLSIYTFLFADFPTINAKCFRATVSILGNIWFYFWRVGGMAELLWWVCVWSTLSLSLSAEPQSNVTYGTPHSLSHSFLEKSSQTMSMMMSHTHVHTDTHTKTHTQHTNTQSHFVNNSS